MYARAWAIWENGFASQQGSRIQGALLGKDLAREMCAWYTASSRFDELRTFLSKPLPNVMGLPKKDQVLHATAALAVHDAEVDMETSPELAMQKAKKAIEILTSNCFPTYGSMRSKLLNLWLRAQVLKERHSLGGRPLSRRELIRLKKRIGCDGDSGTSTTPSADVTSQVCLNGPPNLGWAY